jgi:hypothetical protein
MTPANDDELQRLARKRLQFRRSSYSYLFVNLFFWAVWWFTSGHITGFTGYPWPVWLMLGWGIALVKQYIDAYYSGRNKELT